jgi:hypothetical protein
VLVREGRKRNGRRLGWTRSTDCGLPRRDRDFGFFGRRRRRDGGLYGSRGDCCRHCALFGRWFERYGSGRRGPRGCAGWRDFFDKLSTAPPVRSQLSPDILEQISDQADRFVLSRQDRELKHDHDDRAQDEQSAAQDNEEFPVHYDGPCERARPFA